MSLKECSTPFGGDKNQADKRGIHWINWDKLCVDKDFGGMGFRKIQEFNLALLGKQAWRIHINLDLLVSKIFKSRYFPKMSFLEADVGANPSYIWRSLFTTQELIRMGAFRTIDDRKDTFAFSDP